MVLWDLGEKQTLMGEKKRQKFARELAEWFMQMYVEVYDAMVMANVARMLAEPIWLNERQEETEEENKVEHKATHLLSRP
jgi:hypothetical protein